MCSQRNLKIDNCYGVNCCRDKLRYYVDNFIVNVTNNRSCLSAFLVADNSYVRNLISGQSFDGKVSSIPIVLRWRLAHDDFSEASCTYNFSRHELQIGENTSLHTWKCNCQHEIEEGNPYLAGGCKEIRMYEIDSFRNMGLLGVANVEVSTYGDRIRTSW
ncbi:hypothetical protein L1987_74487 [Smallanthus sonchifolius]|uniref:Uncharacterized protein n=1 Tax=Smallanthus sonchifolius TaxID=185202 RepID=A0ACB9A2R2_9ASTR|nr:hypothetical protein L1987_74487 [Smallanthus sonchifolius]